MKKIYIIIIILFIPKITSQKKILKKITNIYQITYLKIMKQILQNASLGLKVLKRN